FALNRLLVVPPAVARLADIEAFRYHTLLHLVRADDLALVSVWNPTFLTALVTALPQWADRLCFDLRRGSLTAPDPRRAAHLESVLRTTRSLPEQLRQIWPRLALISCWTDAAASRFVPELRELFPAVEIQSKGLVATEGFVSFPLVGRPAAALAIRSHFFEFDETPGGGQCRLARELERRG